MRQWWKLIFYKNLIIKEHIRTWRILKNDYGFPQLLSGKESAYNAGELGDACLIPGSGRSSGRKNDNHPPVMLPRKSQRQRSLAGYRP